MSLLEFFHGEESENYDKKIQKAVDEANEQLIKDMDIPEGYKRSTNPENISGMSKVSPGPQRWKWNEAGAPEPER